MSFVASKNAQCHFCGKTVYAMERMDADGKSMHKACFKCEHCQCVLKLGNFAAMGGRYFCKPHFKQLFKEKGNYHSGFGSEDAKSKWAPQAVVYGAPGSNFMKASASEWDSRQTKSFRMPRPRTDADAEAPKSSTLNLSPRGESKPVSSAPSSPAPATASSSSISTSPPSAGSPAGSPAAKPPRESLAQLASVGALKSVGERWGGGGSPTGPAADASRDQRRRAALEARKAETDASPTPERKADAEPAAPAAKTAPAPAATPAPVAAAATPAKTVDELKAELEQERSKFASDKASLDDAKTKFEADKQAFEEQRKAFEEQKKAFEEEKKQWTEAHPQSEATEVQEPAAVEAEVQA